MKITRRFTQPGQDVYSTVEWTLRTSRISNADGSTVRLSGVLIRFSFDSLPAS